MNKLAAVLLLVAGVALMLWNLINRTVYPLGALVSVISGGMMGIGLAGVLLW